MGTTMNIIVIVVLIAAYKVLASTKTYNVHCLSGSTLRVEAPDINMISKYKDYKEVVCVACGVTNCKETRLFDNFKKKNDGDRIVNLGNLAGLSLKNYGSDEIEVSYKCPGGDVKKVLCYTSSTMKQCLTTQCDECKNSKNCEVYVGTKKVSSGRVSIARGTYQVDTKTSKTEKLKQSLEKIKTFVTSDKAKGVASAIGATVINNKDNILKLAKVIGVPEDSMKNMDQIIRLGNSFYTRDFDGGLKALVELTGRPLSKEEEEEIETHLEDGEINYTNLFRYLEAEKEDLVRCQDLHQDHPDKSVLFWESYWLYIIICVAAVLIISATACMVCCCGYCMRQKSNRIATVYHPHANLETSTGF